VEGRETTVEHLHKSRLTPLACLQPPRVIALSSAGTSVVVVVPGKVIFTIYAYFS